jgi:hypothetical protein
MILLKGAAPMETVIVAREVFEVREDACRSADPKGNKREALRCRATPVENSNHCRFLPASDQRALEIFFPAAAQTLRDILDR